MQNKKTLDKTLKRCYNKYRKNEKEENKNDEHQKYFDNLYMTATTDEEWGKINEYEYSIYEMEEGFEEWAEKHNIDLTAMGAQGISILQYWAWDFED